ncbi:MAG: hypothetical protein JXR50_06790 [Prolixibacteraceae bacterium]|nr:hypothetical protein [Prolixibacteraceae bacterium]MBN2649431.1 hypothetical protein [Prolixibacteraceae bacterium]
MNWQSIIEQTIAMLLPMAIVFLFVYYMLKSFFDQFNRQRKQELRVRYSKETLPLRLQAYERIVLLLERIKPESLVMRLSKPELKTVELQRAMLESIRNEFDHNLSQQIYLSDEAWRMVEAARHSMMQLLSATADEHAPDSPYMEYATDILDEFSSISDDPLTMAIRFVQKEAKELM